MAMRRIVQVVFILIFILASGPLRGYCAVAGEPENKKIVTKGVSGKLISLKPMNNPTFIGIAAPHADVYLKIAPKAEIVNKKSLKDIKIDDEIDVTYEEITTIQKDGRERLERVAKMIRFIRAAPPKPKRVVVEETADSEKPSSSGALVSMED